MLNKKEGDDDEGVHGLIFMCVFGVWMEWGKSSVVYFHHPPLPATFIDTMPCSCEKNNLQN